MHYLKMLFGENPGLRGLGQVTWEEDGSYK